MAAGKPWITAGRESIPDNRHSDRGSKLRVQSTGPLGPDLDFSTIDFVTEAFGSTIAVVGSTVAV